MWTPCTPDEPDAEAKTEEEVDEDDLLVPDVTMVCTYRRTPQIDIHIGKHTYNMLTVVKLIQRLTKAKSWLLNRKPPGSDKRFIHLFTLNCMKNSSGLSPFFTCILYLI